MLLLKTHNNLKILSKNLYKTTISFFLFFTTFIVYIYTLASSVAPQGDSGELITVAYTLGIAHPPGYPLYTMLAHLFTKIPWESVAWRINLFSAVSHSLTVVIVYWIMLEIFSKLSIVKSKISNFEIHLIAAAGSLILAFSYTFWLYSLVAEVFSLNDLLAALIIWIVITNRPLWLLTLLFGLAISNHHTIVLLLPSIIYYKFKIKNFKLKIVSIFSFILGLSPYLYILYRARTVIVPVTWTYPDNLQKLWHMFIRADYGSFSPTAGFEPSLALINDKFWQISNYLGFLGEDFVAIGLGLAVIGVVFLFLHKSYEPHKTYVTYLLLSWLFTGPLFLFYASFPVRLSITGLGVLERFYLLPNIFLATFIGIGIYVVAGFFHNIRVLRFLIIPLLLFYIFIEFSFHLPEVNQRNNYLARDLGKNLLANVEQKAIILPQGDVPIFAMFYNRYAENYRTDTDLITLNLTLKDNNYRYLRKSRPDLDWSDNKTIASISGFVTKNIDRVPLYSVGRPSFKLPEDIIATPSGLLFRLVRKDYKNYNNNDYNLPSIEEIGRRRTLGDAAVLDYYVGHFGVLGEIAFNNKNYKNAEDFFQKSLSLQPYNIYTHIFLAKTYAENKKCLEAEKEFFYILELNPKAEFVYKDLENLAKNCFHDPAKQKIYEEKNKKYENEKDSLLKL